MRNKIAARDFSGIQSKTYKGIQASQASDDNSSTGQIIKLGTEDGGSSFGDMASVGDMALDMASVDDDQSGSFVNESNQSSNRGKTIDYDKQEKDSGQLFEN